MNRYILILKFCLIGSVTFAQNYVELLKISASTTPNNTFDSSDVKTKINEALVDLSIPIKINSKLAIISGVIYENNQTKLFADGITKTFGSTTLKLGFNKQLTDKWATTIVALPKIASDYNSYNTNDFQLGGVALFKYKKHDNLNYKMGLYYNSELFGPFFVPMVGMYYLSPNKKFETNIMLPLQVDMNYQLFPFMNIGANFNGLTRSSHLNNITDANPNTYVSKVTNELFGYLKFNITKSVSLQTKVGQSFARSYKVYDSRDKVNFGLPLTYVGTKRQQLNSKFSNGLIFQFTVLYRLNLTTN
jgi:hypothetical protein